MDRKGFTLLELLIVITIIAVLSVILIIVINPVETLRKSRDSQRLSDLATLKTAIGVYTTSITSPTLASTGDSSASARSNFSNIACQDTTVGSFNAGEDRIFYSYQYNSPGAEITDETLDDTTFTTTYGATQVGDSLVNLVDGTGWIPVKFDTLTGGTPISNLPLDPVNTISSVTAVAFTDTVYRYACSNVGSALQYEINATLESSDFTTSTNDRIRRDGGDNDSLYEVGTNLKILGAGATNQF